jgi:tetratricopeptide (TPR) repeat protein
LRAGKTETREQAVTMPLAINFTPIDWCNALRLRPLPCTAPSNIRKMRITGLLCFIMCLMASPPHGEVHLLIAEVTEQIRADPQNGELYFTRGRLYQVDGDFDNAMVDYLVALQLDTSLVMVPYFQSKLCFEHGMMDRAMVYIDQLLERFPQHAKGRYLRSLISIAMEHNRSALDDIRMAIVLLDPVEPEHFLLAANAELQIDSAGRSISRSPGNIGGMISHFTR